MGRGGDRGKGGGAEIDGLLGVGAERARRATEEAREAPVLETDVVIVVEVVDADHGVSLLEEHLADARGDESGAAGDEVVHGVLSWEELEKAGKGG